MNWHKFTNHVLQSDTGHRIYRMNPGEYALARPDTRHRGAHLYVRTYATAEEAKAAAEDAGEAA